MNINPLLLSVIRKTMPNLIANQILGVQPMTSNSGLGAFYAPYVPQGFKPHRLRFTKANYRHFLRLNDRKTSQTAQDLEQAGYRYQIRSRSIEENAGWIKETFGDRAVTFHNMIYFAYEEDLTLYLLRWS